MITQGPLNLLGSQPALTNPPASAAQVAAQTAIAGLVGSKVFLLGSVPQGTTVPYLVIEKLQGGAIRSFGGQTGEENGLVRVHCFCASPTLCEQLAQLVGELLDSFRGYTGPGNTVFVQGIFQEDAQNQFPPPTFGDEAGNPEQMLDFKVWQTGTF